MEQDSNAVWKKATSAKNMVDMLTSRVGKLYMVVSTAKSDMKRAKLELDKELHGVIGVNGAPGNSFEKIGRLVVEVETDKRIYEQSDMELVSVKSLLAAFEREFEKHVEDIISINGVPDGSYVIDLENRKVVLNG